MPTDPPSANPLILPRVRITICGIPELGDHCGAGVTHVLSILDPEWPDPPAFGAFPPHRRLSLRFNDVIEPTPPWLAPARDDVERLLAFGHEFAETAGAHLLVHCHAGVSRSTASAALILAQAHPEWPASAIFDALVRTRPRAWPNLRIVEFGDELLDRRGELVAGVAAVYRAHLMRDPDFGHAMRDGGRGREVLVAQGPPAGQRS